MHTHSYYIRKKYIFSLVILLATLCIPTVSAQKVVLKSNLLYWGTLSPNLGTELRLSRHFTLNLEAAANPFEFGDKKLQMLTFTPEVRYWFAARPQAHYFVGAMVLGSIYDIHYKDITHKGDALGAGLTFGYSFVLSKRLSLEATIGGGLLHYREIKNHDGQPMSVLPNNKKTILAPLKAGLTLAYILK